MDSVIAKNQKDIERYRQKIFRSKEECRKIFAKESFEKKIRIAFGLYERAKFFKKFKSEG